MDQSDTNTDTDTETTVSTEGGTGTDTDLDTAADTSDSLSDKLVLGGAIAVIGIITSGVAVYILDRVGPAGSGEIMWILGYGLTIFALWYLLLRPIDFTDKY